MKKVALIGLGMVAGTHVKAIAASDRVQLSGLVGRNLDRAAAFAAEHAPDAKVYKSVAELAADPMLDFVIVATPPDARVDITRALVDAGKPILMEKPIERTLTVAQDIVAMCDEANLPLGMVFQHRMRPAAQELIQLVDEGMLGPIAAVEIHIPWWRPQSYYDELGRGTYDRDGGGVMLTQAIHTFNVALRLTGPVQRVQAMTRTTALHHMEAEDFVVAGLEFASGAVGSLFASTASFPGGTERIALRGANGSAILDAAALTLHWKAGPTEVRGGETSATGGGADPMAFTANWHQGIIDDFADALNERRAPCVTGQEALHVHALINAIEQASKKAQFTMVEMDA